MPKFLMILNTMKKIFYGMMVFGIQDRGLVAAGGVVIGKTEPGILVSGMMEYGMVVYGKTEPGLTILFVIG